MVAGQHAAPGLPPFLGKAVFTMDEGGRTYNIRVTCENNPDFWVNLHIDEFPTDPEDEDDEDSEDEEDDDAEQASL